MDDMDVRWLTYAELAESRGISVASATRMAFRQKWRRQAGNDKITRVAVPLAAIERREVRGHDARDGAALTALAAAVDTLKGELAQAHAATDRERERADALRDRVGALEVQLAQLEAEGAAAAVQVAELTGQLRQAREDAEALRQAEAARRARGRLVRAWRAWRGQ